MDATTLSNHVTERTASGLVEAISRLIRDGEVTPGERLPTVRALAAELGIGVATVSQAWSQLAEAGMVTTRGRAGSFVPEMGKRTLAGRFFRYSRQGEFRLDLSNGVPDPALLPRIDGWEERLRLPVPSSYIADPVIPELEEQIRSLLPFPTDALTVVDGALDALDRLLGMWLRLGDGVAVADPGFPPTFDLIEEHGGVALPVVTDDEGMLPDSLARALSRRPAVVIVQPRAHNPTGASMTGRRARQLAEVIEAARPVWVIEDDHSGGISSSPLNSLAVHLPSQVVHVTSFSKSHGPDFRLAAIAGPPEPLGQLTDRRRLGPAWSPRVLQMMLAEMLADPGCRRQVATAREEYASRRAKFVAALAERGIECGGSDGLNLWVPVPDEQAALVTLASRGIAVAPGRPFRLRPGDDGHIRVTTGVTGEDLTEVAELLAG